MKLSLPSTVSSPADVSGLIVELREYDKWLAHNEIKHRAHAKKGSLPPELTPLAHDFIRSASGGKLLTSAHLGDLITALDTLRMKAPVATITLAAPVTKDLRLTVVEWCRTHLASDVLVAFEFNSTILGGVVVRFGSHVYDWSFRRSLLHSPVSFAEVLRRV